MDNEENWQKNGKKKVRGRPKTQFVKQIVED